jgi:CRISPR system Cascade subunit CasA
MHDLLTDPLIRVRLRDGPATLTLPGVYAALAGDAVEAFTALRPHQRHAWHMFLAQVGALALHRGGLDAPPATEAAWADLLRALTPGQEQTAWALVVEDATRPALLQPPVAEGGLAALPKRIATPDALDVLITAKNFDLKGAVAADAAPDDWLFALVSLQTMEGYSGKTRYGVTRMKHGDATRAFLGLAPEGGVGAHVSRDMRAMLALRGAMLETYEFYPEHGGLGLTWLAPWDGATALRMADLDLWFVEVCRRVRLVTEPAGRLSARSVGTASARIAAKELNGVTGDFWAPVNRDDGKAFSLDARGFSTRVLTRLLFGEGGKTLFTLSPAMAPQPGEGAMRLVARGVTRGQGKTEGLHERIIPFRRRTASAFATPHERERLAALAEHLQKEADQVGKALRLGCAVVTLGGGTPKKKEHYAAAAAYQSRIDAVVDAQFFAALQDRFEAGEADAPAARAPWLRSLVKTATALLSEAAETIPCATLNRPRARVRAWRAFRGALWGPKSLLADDRALIEETADAAATDNADADTAPVHAG